MTIVEPGAAGQGLFARVKATLTRPGETWDVIDGEPASIGGLFRGYVIPLAAIPVVASFIGLALFGSGAFGVTIRYSPVFLVIQAVASYALSLIMVYVVALVIDGLAPNFGGTKDRVQAFKLAAYAPTAAWVSGIFALYPPLAMVGLLGGLYTLYLLYVGLPKLMKAPTERATGYFAVVLVACIVVGLVLGAIIFSTLRFVPAASITNQATVSGKVNVPGVGSVDVGDLQDAAKQFENAKDVAATDPESMKALLPAAVGGFTRGEIKTSSGSMGEIEGSEVAGQYARGDASLRLKVTDLGGAGALAGLAAGMNVKSSSDDGTSYERIGKVDGRMTTESYNRTSKHGEYAVLIGERFMVSAEGDGVTMDELKAAVAAVPAGRLEGMAKAR